MGAPVEVKRCRLEEAGRNGRIAERHSSASAEPGRDEMGASRAERDRGRFDVERIAEAPIVS
jgi:hypothetical protein